MHWVGYTARYYIITLHSDWSNYSFYDSWCQLVQNDHARESWVCAYTLVPLHTHSKKMQHSHLSNHTVTHVLVRKTQIVTHTKETNLTLATDSNHGCKSNETCTSIIRSPASLMKQTEHQTVNSDSCCVIRETIMGSQLKWMKCHYDLQW